MKKITIGWISDNLDIVGGGEATEYMYLLNAPSKYNIVRINNKNLTTDCDIYILNNIRTFSNIQIDFLIHLHKKYIMCWRDILDSPYDKDARRIYDRAIVNIFLSPLHKESFYKKFGVNFRRDDLCIAPPFNSTDFETKNSWNDRKKDICWVGSIWHHKGIEEVLLWARENNRRVDFYGKGNKQIIDWLTESKYADYKGYVNNVLGVYKQYKYFIHMPDTIEVFGRSCMEAYLSDCKIIKNNKIGMFSWSVFRQQEKDIKDWVITQKELFWKIINLKIDKFVI